MQEILADPTLKNILIAIISVIVGIAGHWIKGFFDERHKRTEETKEDLNKAKDKHAQEYKELFGMLHGFRDELKNSYNSIKDYLSESEKRSIKEHAEVSSKVQMMSQQLEQCVKSVAELQGRMQNQTDLTASHIHTIGHMSRQIDALFKAIDAPPRATDKQHS